METGSKRFRNRFHSLFFETFGQFSRRRWAEAGQGPTRDESFGTDFTNKCRRLNAGMSQDGSLSLNHRLPAAFLPPRPAAHLLPPSPNSPPSSLAPRLVLPFLAPPLFRGASPPPKPPGEKRKRKAPIRKLPAPAICHMPT